MPFHSRHLLALGLALIALSAAGQSPGVSNLRLLNREAGYIFDGTVLSVKHLNGDETNSVATVEIAFRVERAMRGTRNRQVLTIREWAGLWTSGERYRPGERLLLFLYSPGKLGLTSPVGGRSGRFAVDTAGNVAFENRLLPGLSVDSTSRMQAGKTNRVDARNLALAIQRSDRDRE